MDLMFTMTIIQEVLELKGLDDPNGVLAAQLYIDITTSSSFVYCGEERWDLKTRQSLELFDRDGSYFNTGEEYEEDFVFDTVDTWNENDRVSINISRDKIKLALKQENKKR